MFVSADVLDYIKITPAQLLLEVFFLWTLYIINTLFQASL